MSTNYRNNFTYRTGLLFYDGSTSMLLATQNISAKARIALRQGWPIPEFEYPYYYQDEEGNIVTNFTATQLFVKANILNNRQIRSSLIRARAKIQKPASLKTCSIKGRIVKAGYISAKAHILPEIVTASLPIYYSIRSEVSDSLLLTFHQTGNYYNKSIEARASITKILVRNFTLHFSCIYPQSGNNMLTFISSNSEIQTINAKARIIP